MTEIFWWEKWEWDAWLSDPCIGMSPLAGRGLWAEMLNLMMKTKSYKVEGSLGDLARLCRCLPHELDLALRDIERCKIAEVTKRNGIVTVVSRRRLREWKEREDTRLRVQLHRNKKLGTPPVTPEKPEGNTNVPSYSYSNSGSVVGKEGEPPWPRADFDAAAKNLAVPDQQRDECWSYYDAQGWRLGNGIRITGDPRSLLVRWLSKQPEHQSTRTCRNPEANKPTGKIKERLK